MLQVWCIGITMSQIMSGDKPSWEPKTNYPYGSDETWWHWNPDISKLYSALLVNMVSKCLSVDPSQRPTLAELRDFVTDQDLDDDFAQTCRSARNPASGNDVSRDDWKYRRPIDPYELGMSRKNLVHMMEAAVAQANMDQRG